MPHGDPGPRYGRSAPLRLPRSLCLPWDRYRWGYPLPPFSLLPSFSFLSTWHHATAWSRSNTCPVITSVSEGLRDESPSPQRLELPNEGHAAAQAKARDYALHHPSRLYDHLLVSTSYLGALRLIRLSHPLHACSCHIATEPSICTPQ
jgi:hypothetical protein